MARGRRKTPLRGYTEKRPFRGETPSKLFQTVDMGAGPGDYMQRQAIKYPHRNYAMVEAGDLKHVRSLPNLFVNTLQRGRKGVRRGGTIHSFVKKMIAQGWKTRHINVDMPFPLKWERNAPESTEGFRFMVRNLPEILLPGGKVFFKTEYGELDQLEEGLTALIRSMGCAIRRLPNMPRKHAYKHTIYTRMMGRANDINRWVIIGPPSWERVKAR